MIQDLLNNYAMKYAVKGFVPDSGEGLWYLNLTPLYLLFDNWIVYLFMYIIVFGYLIYSYIKIEVPSRLPLIQRSRIVWISFGIFNLIAALSFHVALYLLENGIITFETFFFLQFELFFAFNIIANTLLFLMLAFFPEALLLSEYQLLHAVELYKFASPDSAPYQDAITKRDNRNKLKLYLDSLPDEIFMTIKAG